MFFLFLFITCDVAESECPTATREEENVKERLHSFLQLKSNIEKISESTDIDVRATLSDWLALPNPGEQI